MNKEIKNLLVQVSIVNLIILIVLSVLCFIFFKEYTLSLALGIIISTVSFITNGIFTEKLLNNTKGKMILLLVSFLRVSVIVGVAFILYSINQKYVFSYLIGYSVQFVSMIVYGGRLAK